MRDARNDSLRNGILLRRSAQDRVYLGFRGEMARAKGCVMAFIEKIRHAISSPRIVPFDVENVSASMPSRWSIET